MAERVSIFSQVFANRARDLFDRHRRRGVEQLALPGVAARDSTHALVALIKG